MKPKRFVLSLALALLVASAFLAVAGAAPDPCFDVPLTERATCHRAAAAVVNATGPPRHDVCFDVPLMDRAACHNAAAALVNAATSPLLDPCFDIPLAERGSFNCERFRITRR